MKKMILGSLATIALSTTAHAGSINLDFRGDMNSSSYNDAAKAAIAGLGDSSRFYLKTGRIDYKGAVNEDLTFRVRIAFTKSTAVINRDTTQTAVEFAYLTHKLSDSFSLSMGRLSSEIGGFETATSGADLYMTSENYARSILARGASNNAGTLSMLYVTGVKATFSAWGQDLHIIAADNMASDPVATGTTTSVQNRGFLGAAWKGSFLEKQIGTSLNYFEMSPQNGAGAQAGGSNKSSFMNAGVRYNGEAIELPFVISADYHLNTYKQDSSGNEDKLSSIVAKFAYTGMEQWIPRLEYFTSEDKRAIGTATTDKYDGFGAVVEYIPKKENTFRYHIAYNSTTMKPEVGDDMTKQEIIVGTRLLADFLK